MSDHGIPRSPPLSAASISFGHLIDAGAEGVILRDRHGNEWVEKQLSWMTSMGGSSDEGFHAMPRPWKYASPSARTIITGDIVVFCFMDQGARRPCILGTAKTTDSGEFQPYNYSSPGADNNRRSIRFKVIDENGSYAGKTEMEFCKDERGSMSMSATDTVALSVINEDNLPQTSIVMDSDSIDCVGDTRIVGAVSVTGSLEVGANGSALLNAGALQTVLSTIMADLVTVAGVAGTTVPATIALQPIIALPVPANPYLTSKTTSE